MTNTDAAAPPVTIPTEFLPYLEKYRLFKLFKDMMHDLVVNMPKDHLKHMKVYLKNKDSMDTNKLILLISPKLNIDVPEIVKAMIRDFGPFVITRRTILDYCEKQDNYKPGVVSPELMAEVTKRLVTKDDFVQNGWLMFDHPCTLREARCLQQDGVLPTITLAIMPTPSVAPPTDNNYTPQRNFFDQDFEALKYAYRATLKEVHIDPSISQDLISTKCYNAIRASASGAQGAKQGFNASGAPGVYRVVLIGPRGAGRNTHGKLLAKHFNLVFLAFDRIFASALAGDNALGRRLREHGPSPELKAQIIRDRLQEKDCIEHGYVIVGFPTTGAEFEMLEQVPNPPNRVIFMNATWEACKQRIKDRHLDWCTGNWVPVGAPRGMPHPRDSGPELELEFDLYFSEGLPEMRAAAGLTSWEVDASKPIDEVQTKIQAALMAAPSSDLTYNNPGNLFTHARVD